MCYQSLAARGIKKIRFVKKEGTTKSIIPQRDEEEVAKKKNIHLRKSRRPSVIAKRARRTEAKKEREGMKNLHRLGLIR